MPTQSTNMYRTYSTCCACHRLGAQPDFQNQKSILYESLEGTGHLCDFLPKFHFELAPIENYWGFAKQWTRSRCDYSVQVLRKLFHYLLTLFLCPPSENLT